MVNKEMMKKEEVKIQQPMDKTKMQPAPPRMPTQPVAPTYQMQPNNNPNNEPKQQQMPQPLPQQPMQPPAYTFPFHMMPVPDIDMTPSPQGWRLMESTSIHIHNHIQNFDIEMETAPQVQPKAEPTPQPVQPIPIQPTPQLTSPIAQEASPTFEPSPSYPVMYPCPPVQPYPYMHHQAEYRRASLCTDMLRSCISMSSISLPTLLKSEYVYTANQERMYGNGKMKMAYSL